METFSSARAKGDMPLHEIIVSSLDTEPLPVDEAETLAVPTETLSDPLRHNVQDSADIAPPSVDGGAHVQRCKGRKDVYLCYKDHRSWPFPHSNTNVSSAYALPLVLKESISTREEEMPTKIRLMVCDGTESSLNAEVGDVMIFPEMVQYKGLTVSKIDSFVEDVLVHESDWTTGNQEKIKGTYIFVQTLGSMSSAVDGADMAFNAIDGTTPLPAIFRSETASRGLDRHDHFVKSSLQIHGHKHHGNVAVYRPDVNGLYAEYCWFSLVTHESDVAVFMDMFSGKRKTIYEVLKRHKKNQDVSKDGQWRYGFFSRTSHALATLAFVSVAAVAALASYLKIQDNATNQNDGKCISEGFY